MILGSAISPPIYIISPRDVYSSCGEGAMKMYDDDDDNFLILIFVVPS